MIVEFAAGLVMGGALGACAVALVAASAEGVRDERMPRSHRIIVSDESTDCATGHCECELCGQPIDPWFSFCPYCGAELEDA